VKFHLISIKQFVHEKFKDVDWLLIIESKNISTIEHEKARIKRRKFLLMSTKKTKRKLESHFLVLLEEVGKLFGSFLIFRKFNGFLKFKFLELLHSFIPFFYKINFHSKRYRSFLYPGVGYL